MGFEPFGDFGLNLFNSVSAELVPHPVLSFELTLAQANAVNAADTGIIVYGKLPLMLTRNCPVKSAAGCAVCGKHGVLKDRKGKSFPVSATVRLPRSSVKVFKRFITILTSRRFPTFCESV